LLNPLRSEQEAFRFLLWTIAVALVVVAVVLAARALL
jgi:predicted nucleic acid-binding Zn ribbon protein